MYKIKIGISLFVCVVVMLIPTFQFVFADTDATALNDLEPTLSTEYNFGWVPPTIVVDHNRSIDDIVAMAKKYPHNAFNPSYIAQYDITPQFTAPYSAGSIRQEYIDDALNAVKMVRYIAGVSYENVEFTEERNSYSQHAAVLLASSNQFSHAPFQPSDMDKSFFDLGYLGCAEGNISAGRNNLSQAVLGFVADAGAGNITSAGHRRWILNPIAEGFGIGYATDPSGAASYGGHRISMHVFGEGVSQPDSYVAWPSSGDFPLEYFAFDDGYYNTSVYPWSINLGSAYQAPVRDDIEIRLTRLNDGRTWIFNKDTPQQGYSYYQEDEMHLSVDNVNYGMQKGILFRPDVTTLGSIEDGDSFNVNISGIKTADGQGTTLTYDINFFSLEKELNKNEVVLTVSNGGVAISGAKVTIGTEVYTTDSNGNVTIRIEKNTSVAYSVTAYGYNRVSGNFASVDRDMTVDVNMQQSELISADVDRDSLVDINDIMIVLDRLNYNMNADEASNNSADVNGDGVVNFTDAALIRNERNYGR